MRFATIAAAVLAAGLSAVQLSSQSAATAIEGVSVIPMDRERVLANQTVVISDGRIASIGPAASARVPTGATRVPGQGRFLIPALAEMHAHVPSGDAGVHAERVLFMYVAGGVGTIRSMLGDAEHLRLRERATRGEILAPTMILAGPGLEFDTARTPEAAIARVTEQKAAGYDLMKILPGVPRASFDAMATAADRAGIRFAGHVPAEVGLQRALEARYATIDHLDGYVEALSRTSTPSQNFGLNLVDDLDPSRIPTLVAQTKAAGTWNVPTQILFENSMGPDDTAALRARPEMRYEAPAALARWTEEKRNNLANHPRERRERFIAIRRTLIKALHDGGAGLLLGSDAPQTWNVPGFSVHRELAAYVASGLTPYQALATGTRNIAVFGNTLDRTGTIETGKRADLLLLEGNPLQQITNTTRIAGVVIAGRWLPKSEIDKRLNAGR